MRVRDVVKTIWIFWMVSGVVIAVAKPELVFTEYISVIGMYTVTGLISFMMILLFSIVKFLSDNWNKKIF